MNTCSSLYHKVSHMHDSMQWQRQNYLINKRVSDVPVEALMVPSRNLLQPQVFQGRDAINVSALNLTEVAQNNGLQEPVHFAPVALKNHCVSMSLNFIKKFKEEKNIEKAAKMLQEGADEETARCSMAYEGLRQANSYYNDGEEVLLIKLRNSIANLCGLTLDKEFNLDMCLTEMYDFLCHKLVAGEYLIRLPGHIISLIKNDQGLFLYDSNQGTIDLHKAGMPWFVTFLEKYKINFSEQLTLIHVADKNKDPAECNTYQSEKINSAIDKPPQLRFKPLDSSLSRWEIAEFTFRDKVYNFVKDKKTGFIYNNNTKDLLRTKFVLLTSRNMFDQAARIVYHVGTVAINLLKLPFSIVCGRRKTLESVRKIKRSFNDIIRTPFYAAVSTGVAIYGIFKPYEGRKLYGYLERCYNRQNDQVNWFKKYYVAPCFVPLNFNVADINDDNQNIQILKKYAISSERFNKRFVFDLFCGWTKAFRCR